MDMVGRNMIKHDLDMALSMVGNTNLYEQWEVIPTVPSFFWIAVFTKKNPGNLLEGNPKTFHHQGETLKSRNTPWNFYMELYRFHVNFQGCKWMWMFPSNVANWNFDCTVYMVRTTALTETYPWFMEFKWLLQPYPLDRSNPTIW